MTEHSKRLTRLSLPLADLKLYSNFKRIADFEMKENATIPEIVDNCYWLFPTTKLAKKRVNDANFETLLIAAAVHGAVRQIHRQHKKKYTAAFVELFTKNYTAKCTFNSPVSLAMRGLQETQIAMHKENGVSFVNGEFKSEIWTKTTIEMLKKSFKSEWAEADHNKTWSKVRRAALMSRIEVMRATCSGVNLNSILDALSAIEFESPPPAFDVRLFPICVGDAAAVAYFSQFQKDDHIIDEKEFMNGDFFKKNVNVFVVAAKAIKVKRKYNHSIACVLFVRCGDRKIEDRIMFYCDQSNYLSQNKAKQKIALYSDGQTETFKMIGQNGVMTVGGCETVVFDVLIAILTGVRRAASDLKELMELRPQKRSSLLSLTLSEWVAGLRRCAFSSADAIVVGTDYVEDPDDAEDAEVKDAKEEKGSGDLDDAEDAEAKDAEKEKESGDSGDAADAGAKDAKEEKESGK